MEKRRVQSCGAMVAAFLIAVLTFLPIAARADEAGGISRFIKIKSPGNAQLAPDGTLYFVHNPDGIRQLFKVPNGKTQEDAVKLTDFRDGIGGYNLSDDGRWITLSAAVGGSEQYDLFLLDTQNRKLEPVLEKPDVVYGSSVWRRDSKGFAYRANDQKPAEFHVYYYHLDERKSTPVYAGKGSNAPVDFRRDASKLVFATYHSASYSQLFEVDLRSKQQREITPAGEEWSFEPIGYTADEKEFLVNTDYKGDLKQIHAIDLATGKIRPLLPDLVGKEVDSGSLNQDRTILAVRVNDDGYSTLQLRRAGGDFAPLATPDIPRGLVGNVVFQADTLLYSLSNANTPGTVFRWSMSAPDNAPVPLTEPDTQGVDVARFRLPQLVRYPSFDQRSIPAFVYLPFDHKPGTTIPFITYYHGGPESQFRPGFNPAFQYFVSRGFGIIAPNVRGSNGYGRAYLAADNYKNRATSVRDGVWAAKYVIDQGLSEPRKIAAWGGSYGGFMTMAVITEAPELYGAACNVVGIVNFETFLKQTKDYRRHLREAEYGPLSDPEFLRSISPLYKVDRIDMPLMIAHGLNDPRVPVGEAMQVAVALKKRGVDVEELYFPDEGHGFAKEGNRLLYYEQLAKFFEEHLR
ncbi:MAG: S9 family peptidase [Phycisphaerae bacterium]|nr:S9 family peptidase [Phycisphaerae bacterium]